MKALIVEDDRILSNNGSTAMKCWSRCAAEASPRRCLC